jgi:uncharacterized membrane protein
MELNKALLLRLRRYLLTGIVVIAPVGVTVFVLWWIFARLDQILGRIFTAVGLRVPGLGLLALLLLVIGVGWVAQQTIGHQLINVGRGLLMRFPLTRSIYGAASQLTEQIVGEKKRFFKGCVLVEYPRPGCWVVGFLTAEGTGEIGGLTGGDTVAVFIPTTPNPTSGYLAFVPRSDIQRLKMSVEEGFKLVISGGAVTPEPVGPPVQIDIEANDGQ